MMPQELVAARSWRFKSSLPHHIDSKALKRSSSNGRNADKERIRRFVPSCRNCGRRIPRSGCSHNPQQQVADLLIGKPGGLTTSEALARGLAVVVVNPIPGQKERDADHLLEQGAAIRCNNLPVIAWKIDRLLDDPARLSTLQERARRLGRPGAASEIAEALLATASGAPTG
jgi:processive 1,2-diacylglycerol beta-glucosyltransferase